MVTEVVTMTSAYTALRTCVSHGICFLFASWPCECCHHDNPEICVDVWLWHMCV